MFLNFLCLSLLFNANQVFLNRRNFVTITMFNKDFNKDFNLKFNVDELAGESTGEKTLIHTDKINKINYMGPITSESCYYLIETMEKLKTNKDIKYINLYLQSSGGSLLPSFGVIDYMKSSRIPINTIINGYVASAGSLISVAGYKRYMGKNGLMLIHSLRQNVGEGNYNNIKDIYDNSNTMSELLKNIYLDNSKLEKNELEHILEHDLWLNSSYCLSKNLIDHIF